MKTKKSLPVMEPPSEPTKPAPTETENVKCPWPTREKRIWMDSGWRAVRDVPNRKHPHRF